MVGSLHDSDLHSLLNVLNISSLGQLIKIIRESQMDFVVDKLIDFSSNKDEELRDISSLGSMFPSFGLPFLTAYSLYIFQNSSEDDHGGTPPRKPNRTEGLRETVTKAPSATHKCKFTPCDSFSIPNLHLIACHDTTRAR